MMRTTAVSSVPSPSKACFRRIARWSSGLSQSARRSALMCPEKFSSMACRSEPYALFQNMRSYASCTARICGTLRRVSSFTNGPSSVPNVRASPASKSSCACCSASAWSAGAVPRLPRTRNLMARPKSSRPTSSSTSLTRLRPYSFLYASAAASSSRDVRVVNTSIRSPSSVPKPLTAARMKEASFSAGDVRSVFKKEPK
mmetsp:Transcript_10754/g.35297  ORF Transcript_10754/g.35297 Transcript_10754/m.35297 type:complete len:200 (-) Transcript_10754:854-1453(-)